MASNTKTLTLRKSHVQASRTHDYLYDPLYTTSSERDHARSSTKAQTSLERVKRLPKYGTMFSELRHHPRFSVELDSTDPVPPWIMRDWRGTNEQMGSSEQHITGSERYKFFRRPLIPFIQQTPAGVVLDQTGRGDGMLLQQQPEEPQHSDSKTRTVYVQTDYRDSETQTYPYSPGYHIQPGSNPEILTLSTLAWGHGLPAGLAEVEMIERARAKRAWEATLPPISDPTQLHKRQHMMEEMEREEWAFRETEIYRIQEARLTTLKRLLKDREKQNLQLNKKRLDKMWSKKQNVKEEKLKHIQAEHVKAMRKLLEKRKQVLGRPLKRDIVQDYSNHGSQTYAPICRNGVFQDVNADQYRVKSKYLDSYSGLLELEAFLPDNVLEPSITPPKPKFTDKDGFVKRAFRREKELDEVYAAIKKEQQAPTPVKSAPRYLQKIEKPVPRPPTPTVSIPCEEEEQRELAVILLQRVVRGRAIQNMMYEGKGRRAELIDELRSTHALQTAEQQVKKLDRQATMALQRHIKLLENKEYRIDEVLSEMEGGAIAGMLDFLSKELIRLQEERRIHALAMLAERERRMREAEESGRRQVEERRRREEDEIFKQLIKVHQDTVDTYLEDVILQTVENTADQQARSDIQKMAHHINDVAYDVEERMSLLEREDLVAELVHSFLLPEVQKQMSREKVKAQQRQYLVGAHNALYGEASTTESEEHDQKT
ncbi:PREDICTED: protein MAATS1-like isoform X2 [Priapulus caudatus]|uniref:Cilia- and flagella-associated protein 91 n=1 Tax=Priapulus caudatus TaxID=37621 RepID=A0ABM1DYJ6_PRICU|nr:PREDICTED: protein MAATS1-like isoform X2 [Priapulus caudatus]